MKIGLVVPIINDRYINGLLNCIEKNSIHPSSVIIIDNSASGIKIETGKRRFHIITHKPPVPLGVNASWNYGLRELAKNNDLISVFNDDLLLENLFFEKMIRLTSIHKEAGVFCPTTVNTQEELNHNLPVGKETGIGMGKREGWAWTIRTSILKDIPPIPDQLKTFCGDDWYWSRCKKLKRPWIKMIDVLCYHFVGISKRGSNDFGKDKAALQTVEKDS